MPTIRLGTADRERFGCAEWLPFDERFDTREGEAFEAAGGEIVHFAKDGKVIRWRSLVWLALHRSGLTVPFDDVHFDLNAADIQDDPGKAPSGSSASRTRRTSSKSSPASRARKTSKAST